MQKITCKTVIEKLNKIIEKYGDLNVVDVEFNYDDDSSYIDIWGVEPYVVKSPVDNSKFIVIFDLVGNVETV